MTLTELPNDVDTLKQLVLDTHRQVVDRDEQIARRDEQITDHLRQIAEREERLAAQEEELEALQSQLAYLKQKLFGQRSEKIDPRQLLLFKELQAQIDELQEKIEQEEITYKRRKGHGRRPLPDDLPTEDVVYPPEKTDCPCCG
jgi:archaellum component FlaC